MRHRKYRFQLGRTPSHRRCLLANALKSLVVFGRVCTTVAKAKIIRSSADRLITLAKADCIASRRRVAAQLMLRYNRLSPKEARSARGGDYSAYNTDRKVLDALFGELSSRFSERKGGYTRLLRLANRKGDCAELCYLEYLPN